jgi:hypothetical protein
MPSIVHFARSSARPRDKPIWIWSEPDRVRIQSDTFGIPTFTFARRRPASHLPGYGYVYVADPCYACSAR